MSIDWSKIFNSPEAFIEKTSSVKVIQTHISYIFVLDDIVYKIKKPVNFGFLDFTTLDKRKHFCEKELLLNRRLCPEIYLDVVPVVRSSDGYRIGTKGEIVDYAVKMKRMPEEGMMRRLLQQRSITAHHIELIVKALVPFYEKAATGKGVNEYGSIETIRFNTEENFQQTRSYVGTAISNHRFRFIVNYTREFIKHEKKLFERRIYEGRIREGHGDLYSANICFANNDKVYIFDCIEFNERFRCGDIASEIAFLAMDLDFHGHEDLGKYLVERFVQLSADSELPKVLEFYKTYRAYVRGKIGCFTYSSAELPDTLRTQALEEAQKYFNLAYKYAGGIPVLIVVFGLTGTGKTYLSKILKTEILAEYLSTDILRKRLAGIVAEEKHFEPFEKGIYSPEHTERTYRAIIEEAERLLREGKDVIVDGTFRSKAYRDEIRKMAEKVGARCLFVHCTASDELIRKRLKSRVYKPNEPSDARLETYLIMKQRFEMPAELPSQMLIEVDTSESHELILDRLLSII